MNEDTLCLGSVKEVRTMVPILVILTFAAFITVSIILEKRAMRRASEASLATAVPSGTSLSSPLVAGAREYTLPGGVFLHPGHMWAHLEFSGEARVGLDDFARRVLGIIERVELPPVGTRVRQGDKALTLHQGTRKIELLSPLDGMVSAVNDYLEFYPERVTKDPYHGGWLFEVDPTNLNENISKLRAAGEARSWMRRELERFTQFVSLYAGAPGEVGATAQDGGTAVEGITATMDDELFRKFTKSFFRV